jgi:hypothetical protein
MHVGETRRSKEASLSALANAAAAAVKPHISMDGFELMR